MRRIMHALAVLGAAAAVVTAGGTVAAAVPGNTSTFRSAAAAANVVKNTDLVLDLTSPDRPAYTHGQDFLAMQYTGLGEITAAVTAVDITIPPTASPSSTSGCEAADFAGFPAGNIALIQRGTCTFRTKVVNAAAAGAAGVIIFNEGQAGRTEILNGTLGQPQITILAVGTTFAVGEQIATLLKTGPVTAHLAVATYTYTSWPSMQGV